MLNKMQLITKLKLLLFDITQIWIGGLPENYKENSLEAFLYIASIAMLTDNKAKEEELEVLNSYTSGSLLHTFNDAINSIDENDIDVIKNKINLDKQEIKRKIIDNVIKNATFNIKNYPTKLVIKNAASSITGEDNRKLSLLSAIRVIACDLEIDDSENIFLDYLAQFWGLKKLLADIITELPKWEEKRTYRLLAKIKAVESQANKIIDSNSITMSTYRQLEEKIRKIYPKLEIKEEWEEVALALDEDNQKLEKDTREHKEKLQQAIIKREEYKKAIERFTPYGDTKMCVELFLDHLSRLDFHSDAIDIILKEFPDKIDIYRKLQRINAGNTPPNKKFHGVKQWKEISDIKTGNHTLGNRGRIYFKKEQHSYHDVFKIYVSVKKNDSHQRNQISNKLRLWV